MSKQTIGRHDKADFPELELTELSVKVDTGAYSSSLHATKVRERLYRGKKHLYFNTLDSEHPAYHSKPHRWEEFEKKEVRSSNGTTEQRYFIKTVIRLFQKNYRVTLSLTDRSTMRNPVLLGRKLIRNKFIVDVNKTNISHKSKTEASQKKKKS